MTELTQDMMTITLGGERLSLMDDYGIRSHCASRAVKVWDRIPGSQRRRAYIGLLTDIHFITLKLGGLLAFHQIVGDAHVPLSEFEEMMHILRRLVGEGAPVVQEEIPNDDSGNGGEQRAERGCGVLGEDVPDAAGDDGAGGASEPVRDAQPAAPVCDGEDFGAPNTAPPRNH